jgi:hypothetical protein
MRSTPAYGNKCTIDDDYDDNNGDNNNNSSDAIKLLSY